MKLDSVHLKILKGLESNSRISNTHITNKVGMSSPAVAERIKKMEDCSVITGYHTKINTTVLGFGSSALVTVRAFMGRLQSFLHKIKTYLEVVNCYRTIGNENIEMEVVLKDQFHLEKFIDELIGYGKTKTQIILSELVSGQSIKHPNT